MLTRLMVQEYGCVTRAEVTLTPLHAFIGPNDSGKSTLLRAVRTAMQLASGTFAIVDERWEPFDPGWRVGTTLALQSDAGEFSIGVDAGNVRESTSGSKALRKWTKALGGMVLESGPDERMGHPWLVHLNPSALREPSELIPDDQPVRLLDAAGRGLPGVYDAIMNRGDGAFQAISAEVRRLFPTIRALRLRNLTSATKALEVELTSGARVPASMMSEGLLYFLAFAAMRHVDPPAVLLVEEPENGLHPARIADVIGILRAISATTQVLIATHSPLVINELSGDEVTVVTRDPGRGTEVVRLCDTPNFAERSRVYALGELWLSYADGVAEAPLLSEAAP